MLIHNKNEIQAHVLVSLVVHVPSAPLSYALLTCVF